MAKRSGGSLISTRPRGQRGMTLIEVLIAVTLVGLLMVGIAASLGIGLRAMERSNDRLALNRRIERTQQILEQQLLNLTPVSAACLLGNAGSPQPMPFFQGEPQQLRFVSTYSLSEAARGYPRILEFTVIPGDPRRNPPGVRLIVNEFLYSGPFSAGQTCFGLMPDPITGSLIPRFAPIQPRPDSFIVADRLLGSRFRYLQYLPPPELPRWVDFWAFKELPEAIAVEIAPLPNENSGVQPMTLVVPLRVDRLPGKRYGD
ncbi:MAG: prepilin-type N-terminal cleavage/methylation domain-containing protein [Bryobacterales bacterium]|nr:prepilin-type N-terminal cleavage/methylation domain-containing protein [Bryobacterales bacterium]